MHSSIKEKIVIFGGAFDPPHRGHERALSALLEAVKPTLCLVFPSGRPPHKTISGQSREEDRLTMAKAAFEPISECVRVLDWEMVSEGPCYTYLTVERVRREYPFAKLFLFVGTDQLLQFETWRRAEYLFSQCTLCAMDRYEDQNVLKEKIKVLEKKYCAHFLLLEEKAYIISSTEIREELSDCGFSLSLSPAVNEYVSRLGLYGSHTDPFRAELLYRVLTETDARRFSHTLAVERECARLCRVLEYPKERELCLCALYHDLTKTKELSDQLDILETFGYTADEADIQSPAVLHGITASFLAEEDGRLDSESIGAIRYHTTGKAGMSLSEKILYFADFIEETREWEGCRELRKRFYKELPSSVEERRKHLNVCILDSMKQTVFHLKEKNKPIHPLTLQALEDLKSGEREKNDVS